MFKTSCAAIALAVSFALVGTAGAEVSNDADTLAIGAFRDNLTFDRAQLRTSHWAKFWQPVFDTVLSIDAEGEIHPNVAETYEYSKDGKSLTLNLRKGLTFTDGAPVDAEAVKANMAYLLDSAGQNKWGLAGIAEMEVVDANTLVLHMDQANPALLYSLATVGGALASPKTLGTEVAKSHPVGSGPYIYDLENSVQGRQYVYNRNPDYWNSQAYPFDRISITPIADLSARLNALRSGQIDAASGDSRAVAEAEASGLTVSKRPVDMFGIFLADRDGSIVPALADVRVRKAINMAVDTASVLKFVDKDFGTLTDQPVVPPNALYDASLEGTYSFDPAAAKALMAEAGYADGFTLPMPELASMSAYNPILEQQLKQIGITIDWQKVSPTSSVPELLSGKFPAFLFRLGSDTAWGDVQKYIAKDAPWNPLHTSTTDLDELIAKAQTSAFDGNPAAFQAINRYLVDNAWFAPWYILDTVYMTNSEVHVTLPAQNAVPWLKDFKKN
jgi:peptide/nickel transport system substrate-binding protein